MYMANINLPIPQEMLRLVDEARGADTPRTAWIRRAIQQRLDREQSPKQSPTKKSAKR